MLHSRLDKKTGARMTTGELARQIGSNRAHVCQVLNNKPGRGMWTRRRLFPHLTEKEVEALGWSGEYNRWRFLREMEQKAAQRSTGNNVPSLESGVAP